MNQSFLDYFGANAFAAALAQEPRDIREAVICDLDIARRFNAATYPETHRLVSERLRWRYNGTPGVPQPM